MQVVSHSKYSIREKKNRIICSTAAKANSNDTPIKHLVGSALQPRTASPPPAPLSDGKQLPKNALLKPCFQKGRQIKSIRELAPLYESKILSKSSYRFHCEESLNLTRNSSQSTYKNRKNFNDKAPKNLLALEQSIPENSVRARSRSREGLRFSQSLLIKRSIIRYE